MSPLIEAAARLRVLLALLPWLVSVGQVPLAEVALRFNLDPSEVVSLLEMASCCGLPPYTADVLMDIYISDDTVYAESTRQLSRAPRLTPSEGFALAASARAILAVPGADPHGALAGAVVKLEDVLGARNRLIIDLDEPVHLPVVRQATDEGRTLDIDYYSFARDAATTRSVNPERLFVRDGHWYLQAWCQQVQARRRFRVDRIGRAEIGGAIPTPVSEAKPPMPDQPDQPGMAQAEMGDDDFLTGPGTEQVVLELEPAAEWVLEAYPTHLVCPLHDGRTRVTLAVSGQAWLERLLLRLGPDARVIEPPDLVDAGRQAAARILKRYEKI
ncbi:MAG: WYL domain-containing protein [Acidimicrobiales bacterium]